jgi:hypothetical protein
MTPHNTPNVICRGTDTLTKKLTDTYLLQIQGFRDKLSMVACISTFARICCLLVDVDNHPQVILAML